METLRRSGSFNTSWTLLGITIFYSIFLEIFRWKLCNGQVRPTHALQWEPCWASPSCPVLSLTRWFSDDRGGHLARPRDTSYQLWPGEATGRVPIPHKVALPAKATRSAPWGLFLPLWQNTFIPGKHSMEIVWKIFLGLVSFGKPGIRMKNRKKWPCMFNENIPGTFSPWRSALPLRKARGGCYCQPWSWQGRKTWGDSFWSKQSW